MSDKQLPNEVLTHVPTMSLRDWMAGMALSSILMPSMDLSHQMMLPGAEVSAMWAYKYADAMMQAREK